MSKNSSKKTRATVSISGQDAQQLELMLRLHYEECRKNAQAASEALCVAREKGDEAEVDRLIRSSRSWDRAKRKAWSYADQFHQIKLDCMYDQQSQVHTQVVRLR